MIISITKLYQLLAEKTDKETAETLTSYIEAKIETGMKEKTSNLVTKEDLQKVKFDMVKWYVALFTMLALLILGLYLKID